jgi:hypothetical protein
MANPIGHPPRRRKSLFSAHANGVTEAMSHYYAECWPLLGFQIPTDLYNRLWKKKIRWSAFCASVLFWWRVRLCAGKKRTYPI